MTNLEVEPAETVGVAAPPRAAVELVEPRDVPLGGLRAMTVRRTLPSRQRSLIGPFCFLDHYGPDDIAVTGGMDVAPHPHTGLQTVTWLFTGHVLHADAVGSLQPIAPGQLNLMTAGQGISHSEEGTLARFPQQRTLHGVQLWTALPEAHRHTAPAFQHVPDLPVVEVDGARVQVVMGSLLGATSAARAYSPLVAAQLDLPAGARLRLPVEPGFEHGLLVDAGQVTVAGREVPPAWLAYLAPGVSEVEVVAGPDGPARCVLIGGEPFGERILMWWNFVVRDHDEVVAAREQWQQVVEGRDGPGRARFGAVPHHPGAPLPAPALPNVRLVPRSR